MYKSHVDIVGLHERFSRFLECLEDQGWLTPFAKLEEKVFMMMINEFYYSLEHVNMSYTKGKVDGNTFHLNANIIEDTTYFVNLPTLYFF